MVKRVKKAIKSKTTRERKKLIVVGTEGRNKSEVTYLRNLERKHNKYHFIFVQSHETDPVKIVRNTGIRARQEQISTKYGDLAVSIFDLDLDKTKEKQLQTAKSIAKQKHIKIFTSNPCFEIWYIEHFIYSTKPFTCSNAVIQELKSYMPRYAKNSCDFDTLYPKTENAIVNCRKLEEHHKKNGFTGIEDFNNPRTDLYKFVELLMDK